MLDGVYKIYRDEGAKSLYTGSFARVLFQMPAVAIAMSVLEVSKPKIQLLFDKIE